ncbi:hypothetical protein BDN70DRAFT_880381 [Pholiota conissans]|uniref:Uncharacterized protein n=1 Tax=Pholiota conissans TaxID=109636 RepID=A0A9P6CZ59_9AGAR|nr:hypothetical protein BDN70DRAFT_880381 [Pholiota conissans]
MFVLAAVSLLVGTVFAQSALVVNTPTRAVVCQPLLITWSGGTRTVFAANDPSGAPLVDFGQVNGHQRTWVVNVAADTSVELDLRDTVGTLAQSAQFTIHPGQNTSCLGTGGTGTAASISATTTITSSRNSTTSTRSTTAHTTTSTSRRTTTSTTSSHSQSSATFSSPPSLTLSPTTTDESTLSHAPINGTSTADTSTTAAALFTTAFATSTGSSTTPSVTPASSSASRNAAYSALSFIGTVLVFLIL